MKTWLFPILLGISIALGSYFFTLWVAPRAVLVVLRAKGNTKINAPFFADKLTAEERRVKLPNPDFLYTIAGFDLSEGPLRISGTFPDTSYYSIAVYEEDTRNFFILNDRETNDEEFKILLMKAGEPQPPAEKGTLIATSGTNKGVILVRELINDTSPARMKYLKEIQHRLSIQKAD